MIASDLVRILHKRELRERKREREREGGGEYFLLEN
jgi:hypothetical protein